MNVQNVYVLIGLILTVAAIGFLVIRPIPLTPKDIFVNHDKYINQKVKIQGCFEPHRCTMSPPGAVCDIDNLEYCCDCIINYNRCLFVDLQSVPREKLIGIRETNETKYYIEVVGVIILTSQMRPVNINAIDLTIIGNCPIQK